MDNKIQLNEEQRQEARVLAVQAMRRAKLELALVEAKILPTVEEQRAYMQETARNLSTNKETKMEQMSISDGGISMRLGLSPGVKEEFIRRKTSGMTVGDQMKLITQIAKELKLGNNQNSDNDSEKIIQNSTLNGSPTLKKPVLHKSGKRLSSETMSAVSEVTEMFFEDGYITFPDYSSRMIDAVGDFIRPYLKAYYELARVVFNADGMTDALEVLNFDIDNFAPIKKEELVSMTDTPLRLINHPWALKALWKLAENLPSKLLEMSQKEPVKLLEQIEETVQDALNWKELVLKKGMDKSEVEEIALTMLEPSYVPQNPEKLEVSEQLMNQIYKKLVDLSNENL